MPGLSGKLWPVHPHRFPDELLSSWLVRLAHSNGLKLQTFSTLALGRTATLWNRDIDRCANDALLATLADQTGSTIDELKHGLLSIYEGVIFERANPNGNTPWILPLGIYHGTRRGFGMQFCPLCLFHDPAPYFRRHWRLALVTICDRHGILLHDRCPQCGAPVACFRNDLGHRDNYRLDAHTLCSQCEFDLRRAAAVSPPAVDAQSAMALRSLVCFHDLGWWFCGQHTINYSTLFFNALRHLAAWLPTRRGPRLLAIIESRTGWGARAMQRSIFEFRPINDRHYLLATAIWLLHNWPHRFIETARSAGLPQSHILLGKSHPFWFEADVAEPLSAAHYIPAEEEARRAAEYLRAHDIVPTVQTVGALVGSWDARAVTRYASPKRQPLNEGLFWEGMDRLYAEIRSCPTNSRRNAILRRDRTMFIVARLAGKKPSEIRAMTVTESGPLIHDPSLPMRDRRRIAGFLRAYLRYARPQIMNGRSGEILFPSIKTGGKICVQEWCNRWLAVTHV